MCFFRQQRPTLAFFSEQSNQATFSSYSQNQHTGGNSLFPSCISEGKWLLIGHRFRALSLLRRRFRRKLLENPVRIGTYRTVILRTDDVVYENSQLQLWLSVKQKRKYNHLLHPSESCINTPTYSEVITFSASCASGPRRRSDCVASDKSSSRSQNHHTVQSVNSTGLF